MSVALTLTAERPLKGSARFSRNRTRRRELRRWWSEDSIAWAAWLMINPSNAGELREDPTSLRVTHFTRAWGFGGWIAVNLYPFISSDPARVWDWADWQRQGPDWEARDDLQANLEDIERAARMASIRIVAFGAEPIERDQIWLEHCLEAFGQPSDCGSDERLFCLGTSKNGQPLHPMARGRLRVPNDQQPVVWRE
jgi:hypothetical protein